jgi:hypothetical protein
MPPRLNKTINGVKYPTVYNYPEISNNFLPQHEADGKTYPCVKPNWDNTPRAGNNGIVFQNSTPDHFKTHFSNALKWSKKMPNDNRIIFIKAWNEWAEGNCLEPEMKYGTKYLEVIKEEIKNFNIFNDS